MMLNKYTVIVTYQGIISRRLNGKRHCTTRPAVKYLKAYDEWWENGVFVRIEKR